MRKIFASLIAAGMMITAPLAANAANAVDYLRQIKVDILYGYVDHVEVGTTFDQLFAELQSRGYDIRPTGNSQNVYTGATFSMWTPKASTFTIVVEGDINGDGKVNDSDVDYITRYLAALSVGTQENVLKKGTYAFMAADINRDGKIDLSDLIDINQIIARH